jgi:hypothetical protein
MTNIAPITLIKGFTLPHIFQLESTGVPMDLWSLCGVHVDFPTVAPPKFVCFSGLQLDSN